IDDALGARALERRDGARPIRPRTAHLDLADKFVRARGRQRDLRGLPRVVEGRVEASARLLDLGEEAERVGARRIDLHGVRRRGDLRFGVEIERPQADGEHRPRLGVAGVLDRRLAAALRRGVELLPREEIARLGLQLPRGLRTRRRDEPRAGDGEDDGPGDLRAPLERRRDAGRRGPVVLDAAREARAGVEDVARRAAGAELPERPTARGAAVVERVLPRPAGDAANQPTSTHPLRGPHRRADSCAARGRRLRNTTNMPTRPAAKSETVAGSGACCATKTRSDAVLLPYAFRIVIVRRSLEIW